MVLLIIEEIKNLLIGFKGTNKLVVEENARLDYIIATYYSKKNRKLQ